MAKKLNWKELTKKAGELVQTEQNASYKFLREKLGEIGIGTLSKLLKRLEVKGLVRRGKSRNWVVLVNADGTPKTGADVPPKRRFKKPVRKSAHASAARANGAITDQKKIEFVQHLADLAEGEKAQILKEVVGDLRRFSKDRKLFDALKG
jgi:DNA-binding transcriptional ArsR family regulator